MPLQAAISEKDIYEGISLLSFIYAPFEQTRHLPKEAYNASHHLQEALKYQKEISSRHVEELFIITQGYTADTMTAKDKYILSTKLENMQPFQLSLLLFLTNLCPGKETDEFKHLGNIGKRLESLLRLMKSKKLDTIISFRNTLLDIRYRFNQRVTLQSSLFGSGLIGLIFHFFLAPYMVASQGAIPIAEASTRANKKYHLADISLYQKLAKKLRFSATHKINLWLMPNNFENAFATGNDNHIAMGSGWLDSISQHIPKKALSDEEWENERKTMKQFVLAHEMKHLEHRHGLWRPLAAFALIPISYFGLQGYNYCAQNLCDALMTNSKLSNNVIYTLKYWNARLSTSPLVAFFIAQLLFLKFMRMNELQADTEAMKELKTLGIDGPQGCINFCDIMDEKDGILSSVASLLSTHPSAKVRRENARAYK